MGSLQLSTITDPSGRTGNPTSKPTKFHRIQHAVLLEAQNSRLKWESIFLVEKNSLQLG